MKYKYTTEDYGSFKVSDDTNFEVELIKKQDAINLCDKLNQLEKKVEYQTKVIDKAIKNEKKHLNLIDENNNELLKANQENIILRKIINELMEGIEYENIWEK